MIVQEYVDKPFLLDGYKFDLRVYVLMTCCDPLRLFLYHDGLVRMGTERYVMPNENNVVSRSGGLAHTDLLQSPKFIAKIKDQQPVTLYSHVK